MIDEYKDRCCGFPSCEEEYYEQLIPKICKGCGADCSNFLCGKRIGR